MGSSDAGTPFVRKFQMRVAPSLEVTTRRSRVAATAATSAPSGKATAPRLRHVGTSSSSPAASSSKLTLPAEVATAARRLVSNSTTDAAVPAPVGSAGTGTAEQAARPSCTLFAGQRASLPEEVTTKKLESPHVMLRAMPSSRRPSRENSVTAPSVELGSMSKPKPLAVRAATLVPDAWHVRRSGSMSAGHCTGTGTTARGSGASAAVALRRRCPPLLSKL
mmetsp:Transcript_94223/g.239772  ORF Transcript_94223/g.239772 Transcript_94223/m.239772 type:complete len:221 (-) Transcript_94223:172-834(-)